MIYEAPPPRSHQKAGEAPMADRQSISGLRATMDGRAHPYKTDRLEIAVFFQFFEG